MAHAKQLASGAWRVQIYAGKKPSGKPNYISITCSTEKEANYAALSYQLRRSGDSNKPEEMTLRDAMTRYIESRDAVLSPSTIREYKQEQKNNLQGIMDIKIGRLTQDIIQREINSEAKTHAPKTVRNIHGLLSAILREYRPSFTIKTKLPQKTKSKIYIPDMNTVQKIMESAKNTELEIPVALAVCLGLRRSEILGLKWENINFKNSTVTIDCAIVVGEGNKPTEKKPKSYAGARTIAMPQLLCDALKTCVRMENNPYVVHLSGSSIYKRFKGMLQRNGVPHMRFHDLRHVNASVMLKLNIPNKYASERMGHATDNMLKNVYQHTLSQEMDNVNKTVNDFFDETFKKRV